MLMKNKTENKKNLQPKLRFRDFINDGDWNGELGSVLFDSISNKKHNSDLPILAITQEHGAIPRDKIDYRVSVTEKSIESYKVVEVGDFIISLRSFQGGIEYSKYKGLCSPAYVILRRKRDDHEGFFKHYFKTNRFIEDLNRDIEGIRDGKMVSYDQFSKLIVPLPKSKIEQQKIADCLSSLDELIETEDKKLEALQRHKKGLMQELFPGEGQTLPKRRFPEFQNSPKWKEKPLGKLFTIGNGRDYKHMSKGDIPVYGTGGYMLSVDDYLYDGESVCIGRKGTIDKPIFLTGKFWTVDTLFYTHSFKDCIPKFIFLIFQNIKWRNHNEAGGVPSLSKTNIEKIISAIPLIPEQKRIADFLSSIDDQITAQTKKLDSLRLHKKGLMQQLFPNPDN